MLHQKLSHLGVPINSEAVLFETQHGGIVSSVVGAYPCELVSGVFGTGLQTMWDLGI